MWTVGQNVKNTLQVVCWILGNTDEHFPPFSNMLSTKQLLEKSNKKIYFKKKVVIFHEKVVIIIKKMLYFMKKVVIFHKNIFMEALW